MKLEDILNEWKTDSVVDKTKISDAAVDIAKLHHKYYTILSQERLILRKYELEIESLKLDKYEFYTQGPNEESVAKGWKIPACGRILKQEVKIYMDGDRDIINYSLKIGIQKEKVELLISIIKNLSERSYYLKTMVDFEKFKVGM